MLRLSLLLCLAVATALPAAASAQSDDSVASRRLVRALRSEEAGASLPAIRALRQSRSRLHEATRLLPTLNCVEAELLEQTLDALATEILAPRDVLEGRALSGLARSLGFAVTDAADSYIRCIDRAPESPTALRAALPGYAARRDQLEALRARASVLSQNVSSGHDRPNRPRPGGALEGQIVESLQALAHAVLEGERPRDSERAWRYVASLDLPEQPVRWRARSQVPAAGTWLLSAGVGFVSLLSSLAILGPEGPPVPMLSSTGFGFLLSGGVATLSAYTWYRPSTLIWIGASALTLGTGALGLYALLRGDRRRRYLGRGLLAGTGLSLFWLAGGLVHLIHDARLDRAWHRYVNGPVQVAPTLREDGAGMALSGRF